MYVHCTVSNFLQILSGSSNIQYMCGIYNTCAEYTVYLRNIQYMCGIYSICAEYTVYVRNIQYMCGIYSTCAVYTVYVRNIQYMSGIYSICAEYTVYVRNSVNLSFKTYFRAWFLVCQAADKMVLRNPERDDPKMVLWPISNHIPLPLFKASNFPKWSCEIQIAGVAPAAEWNNSRCLLRLQLAQGYTEQNRRRATQQRAERDSGRRLRDGENPGGRLRIRTHQEQRQLSFTSYF